MFLSLSYMWKCFMIPWARADTRGNIFPVPPQSDFNPSQFSFSFATTYLPIIPLMCIIPANFISVSVFPENHIPFNTYVPVITVTLTCFYKNQLITNRYFAVFHVPWTNVNAPWLFQSNPAHFSS